MGVGGVRNTCWWEEVFLKFSKIVINIMIDYILKSSSFAIAGQNIFFVIYNPNDHRSHQFTATEKTFNFSQKHLSCSLVLTSIRQKNKNN